MHLSAFLSQAFALLLISWQSHNVAAIPSLHNVNSVDLQGQQCPLPSLFNQECPYLCVRSLENCPSSLMVECAKGESICGDGLCHASCDGIPNPCDCGGEPTGLVTCPVLARATIKDLITEQRTEMIANGCSKALGLSDDQVTLWDPSSQKKYQWLNCPLAEEPVLTFKEPILIAYYAIVASASLILGAWFVFRKLNAKHIITASREAEVFNEKLNGFSEADTFYLIPYKYHWFGIIARYTLSFLVLYFMIMLSVLVADNYGAFNSTFYYFFLSSDIVSKFFVFHWYITSALLALLTFYKPFLGALFRIQSSPKDSDYILIKYKIDEVVLITGASAWITKFNKIQKKLYVFLFGEYRISEAKVQVSGNGNRYFVHQSQRYILNPTTLTFNPHKAEFPNDAPTLLSMIKGLSQKEVTIKQEQFGPNLIDVKVATVFKAIIDEVTTFFYLYQMMCLWIWYFFTYYQMGIVQTVVIIVSAAIRVFLRIRSEIRLRDMAQSNYRCQALRDGVWVDINSSDLVPGDIYKVKAGDKVPSDSLLLSGEVIVDESMLTGEAMPVRKIELKPTDVGELLTYSKICLSSGTDVLQVTPSSDRQDSEVIALVTATGIYTGKGQLMQKILFPSEYSFVFLDHLRVVIMILLTWGAICFGLSIYLMGRGDINSWFYGMFVISQIMSPLLPSALVAGQSIAASRLKEAHSINCVDLPRIMVAGKVKIFCFDKTGTLTKEGLSFFGLKSVKYNTESQTAGFDQLLRTTDEDMKLRSRIIQMGLAACHSVSELDGKLIGNPVDVEMFQSSKWVFDSSYDRTQFINGFKPLSEQGGIRVVKCNEFIHSRASMSVIIEDTTTGEWHIFIKGSFEKVKGLCKKSTIPSDYDHATSQLAREGCYVLAMAHHNLGILDEATKANIKKWSREAIEREADFLSLILFRNQLKEDTISAIASLKEGAIRPLMITGDNAFTGIYVGRACGMIPENSQVLYGDLKGEGDLKFSNIEWMDVDTDTIIPHEKLRYLLDNSLHPVELAISGKAFDFLVATQQIRQLLPYTRIFARMTPTNKVTCVELQMELGITGMCGDGGNDCGALRAAHVGIALSEADASIVSPFSAKDRTVTSCVTVVRYGRAALASSFSSYKFIILYGEIMAWLELTQFYFSVVVSQPIWITVDGFVTVLMLISLTLAKPADSLAPQRPTAKLLAPQTLISAISQSLVNLLTLVIAIVLLFQQSFYRCREFDGAAVDTAKWWLMGDNYEAEIIGLVCLFQFINAAGIFNFGHHYRASWWRNYPLVICYLGMMIFASYLVLANPNPLSCIFRVNCGSALALTELLEYPQPNFTIPDYNNPIGHNVMPFKFRGMLYGLILANCALNYFIEYVIVLNKGFGLFNSWFETKDKPIKEKN